MQDFLIEVLEDARLDASEERYVAVERISAYFETGQSKSAFGRFLRGKSKTQRQPLDVLVNAYCSAIPGTEPMAVWKQALADWARDPVGRTLHARQKERRERAELMRIYRSQA